MCILYFKEKNIKCWKQGCKIKKIGEVLPLSLMVSIVAVINDSHLQSLRGHSAMSPVIFYEHYKPHVVDISKNNHHTEVNTQFMSPQSDKKITFCVCLSRPTVANRSKKMLDGIYLSRPLGDKAFYISVSRSPSGRGDVQ